MVSFPETNIGKLILASVMGGGSEKLASKNIDVNRIRKVSGDLEKVAGLPYKEEVYNSVQELVKIAAEFLKESADELEASMLRQAELTKAMEMRSILDDMIHYGILDPAEAEDKIAELSKKNDQEIEIVKTAVEMIKSGKSGYNLFDTSKTASLPERQGKRGMFDNIF